MKAVVWHGRGDVRVEEWPEPPPPPPGWVQVRVGYCGICGTDLEEWRAGPLNIPVDHDNPLTGRRAPLVLGHEWMGRVIRVGDGVEGLSVGDRVAADTLVFCGRCEACRDHLYNLCVDMAALGLSGDGGMAPWVNAPATSLWPVPDAVPDQAAALAEPLAVAVRAVRRGGVRLGQRVLVTGAGAVGLFAAQVARDAGATAVFVSEPDPMRQTLAERFGARVVWSAPEAMLAALSEETGGRGVDTVIECSGRAEAVDLGVRAARPHGRIVLVGFGDRPLPIDPIAVQFRELELVGSLSHIVDQDLATAVDLLATGRVRVDNMVSRIVPLDRAVDDGILSLGRDGQEGLVKVLIDVQETREGDAR